MRPHFLTLFIYCSYALRRPAFTQSRIPPPSAALLAFHGIRRRQIVPVHNCTASLLPGNSELLCFHPKWFYGRILLTLLFLSLGFLFFSAWDGKSLLSSLVKRSISADTCSSAGSVFSVSIASTVVGNEREIGESLFVYSECLVI